MNPIFLLLIYWIYKICKYIAEGNEGKNKHIQSSRLTTLMNLGRDSKKEWIEEMHFRYGYKYDPWYPTYKKNGKLTQEEYVKWDQWIWDNLKS